MQLIRLNHKDGDKTAITLIYLFNKFLKLHRESWDKEDACLNRYYKGILTKTLKKCENFIEKYKNKVNYKVLGDVEHVLDSSFEKDFYNERNNNLEIIKTGFYSIILIDTAKKHKKKVIGVVLKSYLKDIEKAFEEYREMYINNIDDVMV